MSQPPPPVAIKGCFHPPWLICSISVMFHLSCFLSAIQIVHALAAFEWQASMRHALCVPTNDCVTSLFFAQNSIWHYQHFTPSLAFFLCLWTVVLPFGPVFLQLCILVPVSCDHTSLLSTILWGLSVYETSALHVACDHNHNHQAAMLYCVIRLFVGSAPVLHNSWLDSGT